MSSSGAEGQDLYSEDNEIVFNVAGLWTGRVTIKASGTVKHLSSKIIKSGKLAKDTRLKIMYKGLYVPTGAVLLLFWLHDAVSLLQKPVPARADVPGGWVSSHRLHHREQGCAAAPFGA